MTDPSKASANKPDSGGRKPKPEKFTRKPSVYNKPTSCTWTTKHNQKQLIAKPPDDGSANTRTKRNHNCVAGKSPTNNYKAAQSHYSRKSEQRQG